MPLTLDAAAIAAATGLTLPTGDPAELCKQASTAYVRDAELWARGLITDAVADTVLGYAGSADADEAQAYEDFAGAVAKLAAAEAAYPGTLKAVESSSGFIASTGWDASKESLLRAGALTLPVEAWVRQALRRLYALPGAPPDPSTVPVHPAPSTGLLDTRPVYGAHSVPYGAETVGYG